MADLGLADKQSFHSNAQSVDERFRPVFVGFSARSLARPQAY
jgi:hypothetical protein